MLFAEYPDGDRQIETWSFLAYIRGREIDRDTCRWECESRILERTSDSFFALLDGCIRESDYVECGHTVADIELDVYLISGESIDGYREDF